MVPDDVPNGVPAEADDPADGLAVDETAFPEVRAALAGLSFLRPEPVSDPMPEEVWERLAAVLAAESAARGRAEADSPPGPVAAPDNVVTLTPRSDAPARRPALHRWVGGLVAASVVVVALGVVGVVLRDGAQPPVVAAGDAPAPSPAAASGEAIGEAFGGAADSGLAPVAPTSGARLSEEMTSKVPAARMVMASNTNYTRSGLSGQVTTLLDTVDVHSAREAVEMPVIPVALPPEDGFTQSWEKLRDCLTWLAKSADAQALVVDRGTFEGLPAGVVVAPAGEVDPATSPPPTTTMDSEMGTLDVWVVKPECQKAQDSIVSYLPYSWRP